LPEINRNPIELCIQLSQSGANIFTIFWISIIRPEKKYMNISSSCIMFLEDKDRSFLIQKTKYINNRNREKKMLLINRKIRTAGLVLAVAGAAAAVTTMAAANLAIAASVAVKKAILENTADMSGSAEAETTVINPAETKI
jgi:preprotein translocase subunit YajC